MGFYCCNDYCGYRSISWNKTVNWLTATSYCKKQQYVYGCFILLICRVKQFHRKDFNRMNITHIIIFAFNLR